MCKKEIFERTSFCIDIYVFKTIHHIVRKEQELKFGIVVCFAPAAAPLASLLHLKEEGVGRVLFCSLIANVVIV